MSGAPHAYEQYRAPHSYEWMLRTGDPRTPPILFVPPLFEELNRTRTLMVQIMRALALEGHGCWLPDLSGTGDSALDLQNVRFADWRNDVIAAADHLEAVSGRRPVIASFRGGCLVDDGVEAGCWWRFAPVSGRALARDLDRASLTGGAEWAGYPASLDMRASLAGAEAGPVSPLRVVRLESDAASADHKVEGPALWRRSEPGSAPPLAAALAADLNEWSRACAAS